MTLAKKLIVAAILLILTLPIGLMQSELSTTSQSAQTSTTSGNLSQATTYGTGLSGGPVVMDVNSLAKLEGSPPSLATMEKNVSQYFVPAGIRLVFLDIMWGNGANTTSTEAAGGYNQAVANWLKVGTMYGINTIFFDKQFGYFFGPPSWDQDFIDTYPSAKTFNSNGTFVPMFTGGSVKQQLSTSSGSSPTALTFPNNVQSGRFVIVAASSSSASVKVTGITDSQSNAYTELASSNHNYDTEIWYAPISSSAGDSVQVSFSGSATHSVYIEEVASLISTQTSSSTGFGTGTTASVGSYMPASCSGCDTSQGTGSFVVSFATSGAAGACAVGSQALFDDTNPNSVQSGSATFCGEYNNDWGYGATTSPLNVPSGSWDEVSASFGTKACSGCTSSSGWTITSPLVYRQFEQDLKQLNAWYGNYTDWTGVGEGATGDRNYYGSLGGNPGGTSSVKSSRAFDNFTMYTYANSVFFQRLVNPSTGKYLDSGNQSKLWSEFVNDRPDLVASTGTALIENANYSVYGNSVILERFYVPFGQTLHGFTLKAWLREVGSPSKALYETVYRDNASTLVGRPLDLPSEASLGLVQNVSVSGVTSTGQWVASSFTATLEGGDYYWVAFTTHGGDASDYYGVNYLENNQFQDIYADLGINKVASAAGSGDGSVLWLTTTGGATVTLYPFYYQTSNNWQTTQSTEFQVSSKVDANEIAFFTSDRAYDPNNITVSVEYPNGTVLTTGQFSVQALHGDEGLTNAPVQLRCAIHCLNGNAVALVPGITYKVVFGSLPGTDNYAGSSGGGVSQDFITDTVNPSSAGYLGQGTWPIFSLGLMNLEPQGVSNNEYISMTDLFSSPNYQPGSEIALRFKPAHSESLQTFSFEVINAPSNADLFNVTLRADDETCLVSGNTCSHPTPGATSPVLAQGTQSFSALNATFRTGPTHSGYYAWVNVTLSAKPHGSVSLNANTFYWIVISATGGGQATLNRDINPRAALVYYSNTDYATSWGPPPDGPSDISFAVVTSVDTISQLAEEQPLLPLGWVAQSFSSAAPFQLKGMWIQSQTSGVSNLNVSIRTDSGSDSPTTSKALASGMIRMNVTSDSQNYVSFNRPVNITANTKYWFVVQGICFLSEFGSSCSSPSYAYATVYRSDGRPGDYGSTAYHYETSSNGLAWTSPSQEGDLNFILVASDATIKTYNTKTLYNELKAEGDQSTSDAPPVGWNAFLNSVQATLQVKLANLATGLAGRNFVWYTGMPPGLTNTAKNVNQQEVIYGDSGGGGDFYPCYPSETANGCGAQGGSATFWAGDATDHLTAILASPDQSNWLPWSSFGNTLDNRGGLRPVDTRTDELVGWPLTARSTTSFNDWSASQTNNGLFNVTQTAYADSFGTILNRMQYNGGYFGTSKSALKVLWSGSSSADGFFPEFLSSAVNVTDTANMHLDSNMTSLGNLEQFNVIVGNISAGATPSLKARLDNFISNGGGFVQLAFGDAPNEHDAVLGLQSSSAPVSPTSTLTIDRNTKITAPYSSISYNPYWVRYAISNATGSAAQVIVKDSIGDPVITTNAYGSGYGVLVEMPYANLNSIGNAQNFDGSTYGSPRDSWVSILINALFYSDHKSSMLPILWESSYSGQQNWGAGLQFSVDGSPSNPLLIWVSNNASAKSQFNIHLNASFYGVSTSGWEVINMQNMSVIASGSGSDIHVATTVQPWSWEPLYIISTAAISNLMPAYNTMTIDSYSVSNSGGTYVLTGTQNSSGWVVLKATSPIVSVSSSLSGTLASFGSIPSLNATKIGAVCTTVEPSPNLGKCAHFTYYNQQGWYYDAANSLLYLHLQVQNPVTITVTQILSTSTSSSSSSKSSSSSRSSTSSRNGAGSPPILDGIGSVALVAGTKTSSFHLTTAAHNNLVVVQDAVGGGGADCTNRDVISDSSGLVWHYRADIFAYGNQVEEWYAEASAPLASDTITVNFCTSEVGMVVGYGISGANLAAPFDSNPSLPRVNSGSGSAMTLTVSTSGPNTMLVGAMSNMGGQGITPPSSFNEIYNGIVPWDSKDFSYGILSSAVTNHAVTWGNAQGNSWLGLVDAIQGATSTTTTSTATTTTRTTTSTSSVPPALDGSGSVALVGGSSGSLGNSHMASFQLTTSKPNDLIVVQDAVGAGGADCTGHDAVSDSENLVWHYRADIFAYGNQVEEWYAEASAPLASDTITVNFCTSEVGMVVGYGISGANLAAPFDSNPSLPRVNSGSGSAMTLTVSTSGPNTMLVGAMSNMGGQGITPPSSFNEIYNGIVPWDSKDFSYGILSSAVTNHAVTWGNAQGNSWLGLVDAIQGATSTTTTSTSTTTTTTTSSTTTTTTTTTSSTSTTSNKLIP